MVYGALVYSSSILEKEFCTQSPTVLKREHKSKGGLERGVGCLSYLKEGKLINHGQVRIESASFSEEATKNLQLHGNLAKKPCHFLRNFSKVAYCGLSL